MIPLFCLFQNEMSTKFLVVLSCLLASSCHASPMMEIDTEKRPAGLTTYDQRQTGKYNVHVNIKDVQFFSLSDSLAGIGGDYADYEGDYGEILEGIGGTDTDYDTAHLTVNPIFAFLGAKPATTKPTTTSAPTTEKSPSSLVDSTTQEASSTSVVNKQESESDAKDPTTIKPALVNDKKPQPAAIDYEEIPVEVQYYRANQQKTPTAINRHYKRQPSVQILGDGHGRTNNVKILENDQAVVKICNRGEYRDALGRCRVRARRGVPGL